MTAVAAFGGAAFAVLKRDFLIFISYRTRLFSQLLSALFTVALLYYISRLVSVRQFPSPDNYFGFVVVGTVVLRLLTVMLANTAGSLRQELVAGTFERMVGSPFGATSGIVSLTIFPFALGWFLSLFTFMFGALLFGVELNWQTAPLALPAGMLATLAFTPFALIGAAAVILFKQAAGAVRFFLVGITFVSGFYFPVDLLPGWIQWASDVQPFTPAVDLLRHLLLGSPLERQPLIEVATMAGFAAVLLPLSYWMLRSAVELSRRRATIAEY